MNNYKCHFCGYQTLILDIFGASPPECPSCKIPLVKIIDDNYESTIYDIEEDSSDVISDVGDDEIGGVDEF